MSPDAGGRSRAVWRLRWLLWGVALLVGAGVGAGIVLLRDSNPAGVPQVSPAPSVAEAQWAAGKQRAPEFALTDQAGAAVSIARFRGRPVIVTFIDPLCRNLCPLEAKVLSQAEAQFPAAQRPAIVAVSVDRWGDARHFLLEDMAKWKLSRDWYWAVGAPAALRRVWHAYQIGVEDSPKTVTGITVHQISHTEAAFVVDRHGFQRALLMYPFSAADIVRTVRQVAGASS